MENNDKADLLIFPHPDAHLSDGEKEQHALDQSTASHGSRHLLDYVFYISRRPKSHSCYSS